MITNQVPSTTDAFTLDKLRKMMVSLPKPDLWLSTVSYPGSDAIIVEGGAEKFVVAHPHFWDRVRHQCLKREIVGKGLNSFPMYSGISVVDIDRRPFDTPKQQAYIDGIWARLREAVEVAMIELPDWLKPEPKFSEHG